MVSLMVSFSHFYCQPRSFINADLPEGFPSVFVNSKFSGFTSTLILSVEKFNQHDTSWRVSQGMC